MDTALAIWQISPAAEYRLDHAHGDQIVEWRGPGPEPTPQQLADAWTAYQAAQTQQATAVQTAETQRAADAATLHTALTTLGLPDAAAALLRILAPSA
jgi:hypothetical protein